MADSGTSTSSAGAHKPTSAPETASHPPPPSSTTIANPPLFNPAPRIPNDLHLARDSDTDELEMDDQSQQNDDDDADSVHSTNAVAGPGPSSAANAAAAGRASLCSSIQTSSANGGVFRAASQTPSTAPKKKARPSNLPRASGSSGKYTPPPLPHYSVVRAAVNTKNSPHVIVFKAGVSDASQSRWPSQADRSEKNKDSAGRKNYYEAVPKDVGRHATLRSKIAVELAKVLGESRATAGGREEFWTMEWPENYNFFLHHCSTSNGTERHDPYIFGSPVCAKFRSANEVIPHLLWLLNHGPNDNLKCLCKYCSQAKSQRDVNAKVGLTEKGGSSIGGSPKPASKARTEPTKVEAKDKKRRPSSVGPSSIGGVKKPKLSPASPPPTYHGAYVSRQRDADLTNLTAHRIDDLVWAELSRPILSETSSRSSPSADSSSTSPAPPPERITHWPGILINRTLVTSASVVAPPVLGDSKPPQLSTKQEYRYDVRLLAVKDELTHLRQDQVRAWLAHPPATDYWVAEKLAAPRAMDHVWDGRRTLRDCSVVNDLPFLEDAVTALALALQIAAHVVGTYALNDRFRTTAEHVQVASPHLLSASDQVRLGELQQNWQFQSIYWGAEHIHAGDVVRLMHTRDVSSHLAHAPSEGWLDRALLMKVDTIFKEKANGNVKIGGHIYELRDLTLGPPPEALVGGGAMSSFEKTPLAPSTNGTAMSGAAPPVSNGEVSGKGKEKENVNENGALPPPPTSAAAATTTSTGPSGSADPYASVDLEKKGGPYKQPASAAALAALTPGTPASIDALPAPPIGYVWRLLTLSTQQVHVQLEYLAGRYHPLPKELDRTDVLRRVVESEVLSGSGGAPVENDPRGGEGGGGSSAGLTWEERGVVLAGLKPAYRLYMKCLLNRETRVAQLIEAEKTAAAEVGDYFQRLEDSSTGSSSAGTPQPQPQQQAQIQHQPHQYSTLQAQSMVA